MTKKAFKSRLAKRDLVECATYIGSGSPISAERFLEAAEAAFESLAAMPGMGALREVMNPRLAGLRSWPITGFRNYLIFYRPTRRGIRILRVLHGARDIENLLRQM